MKYSFLVARENDPRCSEDNLDKMPREMPIQGPLLGWGSRILPLDRLSVDHNLGRSLLHVGSACCQG
jgi:hypothetical protein